MPGEWAILQLREPIEPVPVIAIERDLRNRWAPVICRFPAVKHGCLDTTNPIASYLFVRTPLSPKLERSTFATRFLRDPITKRLQKVTDDDLLQMAPSIILPAPGMTVAVTAGDFTGLQATVVSTNCRSIKALVELWSTKAVIDLAPNEFLPV